MWTVNVFVLLCMDAKECAFNQLYLFVDIFKFSYLSYHVKHSLIYLILINIFVHITPNPIFFLVGTSRYMPMTGNIVEGSSPYLSTNFFLKVCTISQLTQIKFSCFQLNYKLFASSDDYCSKVARKIKEFNLDIDQVC